MRLPWINDDDPLPNPVLAWGADSEAPGLLAVGGQLSVHRLREAYRQGIFPWYSDNQPILWWSPDPRMVLPTASFRLHRSLRKTLTRFIADGSQGEIRIDTAFDEVIAGCACTPRRGQEGTWIVPDIQQAYRELHRIGLAHSVETWINGRLAGGLYCASLGRAVFGESMFARTSDASKIALAALVAFCRVHAIGLIDCQQKTPHLASLGAQEIPRSVFLEHVRRTVLLPSPQWEFDPVYWSTILST